MDGSELTSGPDGVDPSAFRSDPLDQALVGLVAVLFVHVPHGLIPVLPVEKESFFLE